MVGQSLQPLADELQPERAISLLSQLGLTLPSSALSAQVRSAMGAAATSAGELPALLEALIDSIEADEGGLSIGAKSVPLAAKLVTVIDGFATIADELGSVALPGLN